MTFYFYDLETSGIDSRFDRIMQFAGQRTDANLQPIGEPHNILVKLTDDIVPSPDAVLITGITPQKTHQDGISEAEFLRIVEKEVFTPDTCLAGFNNIRFDDEFMRFALYRNLCDPYEREWKDGRSRWDLIDLVRMTRALRPEGLEWPVVDGKPSNRLEELAKANKLTHISAHDALSDVEVTIDLARLLKAKQPKLFEHFLSLRDKKVVASLLNPAHQQPVVYTSGRYSGDHLKTTAVLPLCDHPTNSNAVLVYDLRVDPAEFIELSPEELLKRAFAPRADLESAKLTRLPVKIASVNKVPAVAPLGVLDEKSQKRLGLSLDLISANASKLKTASEFIKNVRSLYAEERFTPTTDVEGQLYDGFFLDQDREVMKVVRSTAPSALADLKPNFTDKRLQELFVRYKARNYPETLSPEEQKSWSEYRLQRLMGKQGGNSLESYFKRLHTLEQATDISKEKQFLLEELKLYGESIAPAYESEAEDNLELFS